MATLYYLGIMRTVYGDQDRFEKTYFSKFPGYYMSGDGAKRDKVMQKTPNPILGEKKDADTTIEKKCETDTFYHNVFKAAFYCFLFGRFVPSVSMQLQIFNITI